MILGVNYSIIIPVSTLEGIRDAQSQVTNIVARAFTGKPTHAYVFGDRLLLAHVLLLERAKSKRAQWTIMSTAFFVCV